MTDDLETRFLALVRDNDARIRRICRVYARDVEARKDLHQDILVQLWRSLPSFEGASTPSTWMYRVALNTALAHRRRQSVRREVSLDQDSSVSPVDHAPMPDARVESRQRLERLYAAIDRLGEVEQALVMMYLDDRSYREIAEVLGISESNVGVKLHRLKQNLAAWLEEVRA